MASFTSNILVPTDFSKASNLALEAANLLAKQNDAKVTLVHVFEPRGVLFGGEPGMEDGHGVAKDVEAKIHAELEKVARERFPDVSKIKTALVISESAVKGIVEYAERENVDLIVIATHGRSGLSRMLIGSVAEKVVRHASCPVLTLRSRLED
ncbi:MAG: universal stress protein [Sandaracinus sp.]|nr:universal stress protein [Myxococcales bacterium]MCB9599490.1 universal stress protein [Sandaracinus sp.]MCB9611407.1 universal stress protein [Sandaracinus sp.]MCB9621754.1 universal stress protein [Sandaracinus sp.]MCB9632253.1 universal stress protein [Sandaracinus sp.]